MISTEEENRAVQCLHDFIYYFNKKDKSKILNCLHYPHMAQSDNNDPTIYKNEEEMWGYIGFLLNKLEKEENWNKFLSEILSTFGFPSILYSRFQQHQYNFSYSPRDDPNIIIFRFQLPCVPTPLACPR